MPKTPKPDEPQRLHTVLLVAPWVVLLVVSYWASVQNLISLGCNADLYAHECDKIGSDPATYAAALFFTVFAMAGWVSGLLLASLLKNDTNPKVRGSSTAMALLIWVGVAILTHFLVFNQFLGPRTAQAISEAGTWTSITASWIACTNFAIFPTLLISGHIASFLNEHAKRSQVASVTVGDREAGDKPGVEEQTDQAPGGKTS